MLYRRPNPIHTKCSYIILQHIYLKGMDTNNRLVDISVPEENNTCKAEHSQARRRDRIRDPNGRNHLADTHLCAGPRIRCWIYDALE